MSKWKHWIFYMIAVFWVIPAIIYYIGINSERDKRIELEAQLDNLAYQLESELFATKKLLFLCESEMQELYNVPGLGNQIDSILGAFGLESHADTIIYYSPTDSLDREERRMTIPDTSIITDSGR